MRLEWYVIDYVIVKFKRMNFGCGRVLECVVVDVVRDDEYWEVYEKGFNDGV